MPGFRWYAWMNSRRSRLVKRESLCRLGRAGRKGAIINTVGTAVNLMFTVPLAGFEKSRHPSQQDHGRLAPGDSTLLDLDYPQAEKVIGKGLNTHFGIILRNSFDKADGYC
jgi:hypothetical protein